MITPQHYLFLSVALFSAGIAVVVTRRHRLIVLLGVELLFQAVNLSLAALTSGFQDWEGHIAMLVLISVAMVELVVGLAAALAYNRGAATGRPPAKRTNDVPVL
jgi:NADH-quinone oxidoreductase subunit K